MDLLSDPGLLAWYVAVFLFVFGLVVVVHELGHFLVARLLGVSVDIFSLGIGPRLASWTSRSGIRYQLGILIPLGGFVRFSDANDAEQRGVDLSNTFEHAPLLNRTAIVLAGPIANVVLAIGLFAGFALVQGEPREDLTVAQLRPTPIEVGDIQPGDVIKAIAGEPVNGERSLGAISDDITLDAVLPYDIVRNGEPMTVDGPFPIMPRVDSLAVEGAAREAGLQQGDVITEVNGQPVFALRQVGALLDEGQGDPVVLSVWRPAGRANDDPMEFTVEVVPRLASLPDGDGGFETRYVVGVTAGAFFDQTVDPVGPIRSLWLGLEASYRVALTGMNGFLHVLDGSISSCNLAGPITVASASVTFANDGIVPYLTFVALLSITVAVFNLLPIPVLDGGHLLYFAYEAATGDRPDPGIERMMTLIGLTLVGALLLTGLSSDLFCS